LTRIRQRLGLPLFRRFFEHVVELCGEAGLIWGKKLLVDATKVQANAADGSIVPRLREVVDDHLVELFAQDEDESGQAPLSADGAPPLLHPSPAPSSEEASEREFQEPSERWDLLDTCRLDPNRPLSQGYERVSNRKISRTDPDATVITMADKRTVLGYQTHYMIDGGRARIILHALTMPGDVMENQPFLDQFRRVLFRWKLDPRRVITLRHADGDGDMVQPAVSALPSEPTGLGIMSFDGTRPPAEWQVCNVSGAPDPGEGALNHVEYSATSSGARLLIMKR
jgi:hypothetical protein